MAEIPPIPGALDQSQFSDHGAAQPRLNDSGKTVKSAAEIDGHRTSFQAKELEVHLSKSYFVK
ncbi:MAG: hypothetical protein VW838_11140 [Paracoccaceae bacterium]